jgi:indoleamine 2,3-dioxygenase
MVTSSTLSSFGIDPQVGYLPKRDPLQRLPRAYAEWEEIAAQLPKLLAGDSVRKEIEKLPPFSLDALTSPLQRERAMMLVSFLGHAYVWGQTPPPRAIPRVLSIPWFELSQKLGRPPILSYASYALYNWRRLDPNRGIELGNIALLQNFWGGIDEEWFILVHVDIEAKAGPALKGVWDAQRSVQKKDPTSLREALEAVNSSLSKMYASLVRMTEWCDPYIYFHRVRPFIHGWKNHPVLPAGLIYEGIEAYGGKPQQFRGETGSQSGIIPALDAGLGVRHADDPLRPYLLEMKDYMPPRHRAFVDALEARSSVREFVLQVRSKEPALSVTYDECIDWIEKFRSLHLEYAANYIYKQLQKSEENPHAVGTGGTPFMPYLAKHRDETAEHKLANGS